MYCGKLYRRNDKPDDHFRFGSVGNVPRRCLHLYRGNKDEASEREKETLEQYTVYSEQTASEMSKGALKLFGADCAVAVTGIAGPSGGSQEKPVGTVYVSVRSRHKEIVRRLELYKEYENLDRRKIRMLTTETALRMVLELYEQKAEA